MLCQDCVGAIDRTPLVIVVGKIIQHIMF